jgi:RimJ/RimL family protein N-acetyltransferase
MPVKWIGQGSFKEQLSASNMNKYRTFETDRLVLSPTSVEDAEFIFELFNTPKWLKFIGDRNIKSIEDAKEYIERKMVSQLERLGFANYTLIRKFDQTKVGICGLYDREGIDGFDIGFAFLPEFEGNGYGFESANKLKQVAFHEFGIHEIVAITTKDNTSSQKLLEKLDMKMSGFIKLPNDDEELLLYKITR